MLIDYHRGHISFHYLPIQNPSHVKNQQGLFCNVLNFFEKCVVVPHGWISTSEVMKLSVCLLVFILYGCNLCMQGDFFKDSWINCMTVKRVSVIDNLMGFFWSIIQSSLGYIVAVLGKEYCIIIKCEGKKKTSHQVHICTIPVICIL